MFDMGSSMLYGQPELGEELLMEKFYDDFVQSLFEPNDADSNNTSTSSSTSFLPLPYLDYCFPTERPFVSLPAPDELVDQCYLADCCYQNPKRQKTNSYLDLHYPMNTFPQYPEFFNFPQTEPIQLPPMVYESSTVKKKSSSSSSGLSPQSIAARQRRRKISEKTQELGKLIPGSSRMNSTAAMFQAAYKYVQYLQAQVGILQLMHQQGSNNQENVPLIEEGLEVLLASPSIQEKLYSEEKCLVPQDFVVETLAKDNEIIQSNPSISKDIALLAQPSSSSSTSSE
ncbi:hypothetical protein AQUCO_02000213v1 [Aquilegia coerulea]|uniref:BHLH domain-containing protein n=1 Tax=Aquilegia coerulea TaxID=218851 RepID=A0A2G5DGG3_AQUCA|nr:hypothetical protein AQUCO_02000213v1 [Aquilegia coerulea]